jgi:predicted ATP-dependent endonuclease of OLD family
VLAKKLALVEGPSDSIILERAFLDAVGKSPADEKIDVVSMDGLTFKRALEVCKVLDRPAIALQDNDGNLPDDVQLTVKDLLTPGKRELLVSDPKDGNTLEPQLLAVNDVQLLRSILGVTDATDLSKWMSNNKTESALRILDSTESITFPDYINRAVELLR